MPILFPPTFIARYPPFSAYGAATTLNPSDKSADITLSNGNLTAESGATDTSWDSVRATTSKTAGSGCFYWEVTLTQATNNIAFLLFGGGNSSFTLTDYAGNSAISFGFQRTSGYFISGGILAGSGNMPTLAVNDVMGLALDMTRGELYLAKNGQYLNGAIPANRINPNITGINFTFFPALSIQGSGGGTTGGDKMTVNFGATAFSFQPPA